MQCSRTCYAIYHLYGATRHERRTLIPENSLRLQRIGQERHILRSIWGHLVVRFSQILTREVRLRIRFIRGNCDLICQIDRLPRIKLCRRLDLSDVPVVSVRAHQINGVYSNALCLRLVEVHLDWELQTACGHLEGLARAAHNGKHWI